jgi:bacterioferritin-associated ferredoxin
MIVCLCHRVSDREIAHHATSGCASFEALQEQTRVGSACGACLDCARQTFETHATNACASCPAAAPCGAVPLLAVA